MHFCHKHLEGYHFWLLLVSCKPIWNCCCVMRNIVTLASTKIQVSIEDQGRKMHYDFRSWKTSYSEMKILKTVWNIFFFIHLFEENDKKFDLLFLGSGRGLCFGNALQNHKLMNISVHAFLLFVVAILVHLSSVCAQIFLQRTKSTEGKKKGGKKL